MHSLLCVHKYFNDEMVVFDLLLADNGTKMSLFPIYLCHRFFQEELKEKLKSLCFFAEQLLTGLLSHQYKVASVFIQH